jgi:putative chitinase
MGTLGHPSSVRQEGIGFELFRLKLFDLRDLADIYSEYQMDKPIFRRAVGLSEELANRWFELVADAMAEFGIITPERQAVFIAQVRHESGGFRQLVESFNYKRSAPAIFSRVPPHEREQLGRQQNETEVPLVRQRQIANLAYGERYGNGDAASGDGWRFRGRELKQITFRDNYAVCDRALGFDLVAQRDSLATVDKLAVRSAGWLEDERLQCASGSGRFCRYNANHQLPCYGRREKRVAFWNTAKSALRLA